MTSLVNLLLIAAAFDSAAWLGGKREAMSREAERLRGVYAWCAENLSTPAEKVRLPVDMHPDGTVKTLILANRAQLFLKEGYIWGEGVAIGEAEEGNVHRVRAAMAARNCAVDRKTRSGWIEGAARATFGSMVLNGWNGYISAAEEYVSIFSNAMLTASADEVKHNGDTNGVIRLSAARADFDRREGVIYLEGGVRLDDSDYTIAARRAFAYLEGTNELKRIEVIGSVAVTNGTRSASCSQAEYDCLTGQLTMKDSCFEFETGSGRDDLKKMVGGGK